MSEHAVRSDRRAAVDNLVEEVMDICATNLRQAFPPPEIDDVSIEEPLRLAPVPCVRLRMPLDELLDDALDQISIDLALSLGRSSGRLFGGGGVFAEGDLAARLLSPSASRLEVKSGE